VGIAKSGDTRWLWHPLASFVSALGVAWGVKTSLLHSKEKDLIRKLQPKQQVDARGQKG
jgi:hypothetical protein